MIDSIQTLRKDLEQFQALLSRGAFVFMPSGDRDLLLSDSEKLYERLEALSESVLTIGLLGGTGVGKSTLMNALAGSRIASTSHRRPHTDQVLVYRHVSGEIPSSLREDLLQAENGPNGKVPHRADGIPHRSIPDLSLRSPWREITHDADTIRQIIVCDLPDFDSLLGEHRLRVLHFLQHLDVIVWVASPEKYADERFYAFLREVPKPGENFYFVLNKVDLLFEDQESESGYVKLARVTGRFLQHLRDNGIEHPLIYAISSQEVMESPKSAPWNQFALFRHQIFQLRTAKEIASIKSANLDVEIRKLFLMLRNETLQLIKVRQILTEFGEGLEKGKTEWVEAGREVFRSWLEKCLREAISSRLFDPSAFVGIGRILAGLLGEWRHWTARDHSIESSPAGKMDLVTLNPLLHQLERLENLVARDALYHGLPSSFVGHFRNAFDPKKEWEDLAAQVRDLTTARLESYRAMPAGSFRILQYTAYFWLTLFFLFALGGDAAWKDLLDHPTAASLFGLGLTLVKTVFSPAGLSALVSYILLQVFLGFRFHARYKKFLQRRAQKFIESLKFELEGLWEEELNTIIRRLNQFEKEVEDQITTISDLHGPSTKE